MPAPAAPTAFVVQGSAILHLNNGAVSNKSAVLLGWAGHSSTAQHRIEKSIGGAFSLARVAAVGAMSATLRNLPNATIIPLRIRAENEEGVSAWVALSHTTGAQATQEQPPLAPASLAISEESGYGALIEWADQSNNEAYFEMEVRRGGDSRLISRLPAMSSALDLNLTTIFSPEAGIPNQLYSVRVRARGGHAGADGYPPIVSAWSDEGTFRTGAASVLITSPASLTAEQGQAFSYAITTNTPCTGFTANNLPAALNLGGNVIAGTITAAPQLYTIALTATNGATTGAKNLLLRVVPSSITIYSSRAALAVLGAAFSYQITVRRSGGVAPLTYTLSGAPGWLHLDTVTGLLTGTPDLADVYTVQIGATDGTRNGNATLTITVPALSITSAGEITIFVGEPFAHQLTATAAASWEIADAPAWLSLDGSIISGTPPALGEATVDVIATVDEETAASQTLLLHIRSLITVPVEISGWQDDPLIEVVAYHGACQVEHWYLSGAPAGVEISTVLCPGGTYDEGSNVVAIVGAPGASGIFEAILTAQACCAGWPTLYRAPVRFAISGGVFLDWFHSDIDRRELQVLLRTNAVVSHAFATDDEGLWLKRGDDARQYVIFRDGPLAGGELGRQIISTGFTELRLVVRPKDDLDAEPYLDLGGAPVTESIAGHTIFVFTFVVTSEAIERAFTAANRAIGAEPGELALKGSAELTWVRNGRTQTSRTFPATIEQDNER